MSNLKSKSKKALAWDFTGRLMSQGVAFIISIFLARLLTPEDFGVVAIVNVIVAFSQIFIDMGLGVSLIQRKEVHLYHYGSVFWFNLAIGTLLTCILYLAAPLVADFFEEAQLTDVARALSFVFIFNAFGRVINSRLSRELKFKTQVLAQILAGIVSGGVGVWMAFNDFGVWALVAQTLIFAAVQNSMLFILAGYGPMLHFRWSALKELWSYGLNMFTAAVLNRLFAQLDSLIIGKLFATGTLGQFNRAKSLRNMLTKDLSGSLSRVMMPVLSSVQDQDDRFLSIVDRSLSLASFFGFFMAGALWVTSRDAVLLVYGWQWEYAADMFQILMLSGFAYPVNSILVFINASKGRSKVFLFRAIIQRLVQTVNFVVGFYFGIEGFLIGLVGVSLFSISLNIYFSAQEVTEGQTWFHGKVWVYGFVAVGAAAIAWLVARPFEESLVMHGVISGGLFVALYIGVNKIFKTKGFDIFLDEFRSLPGIRLLVRSSNNEGTQ